MTLGIMSDHISVCICTFKRPEMLTKALESVTSQITNHNFSYEIIIVDNDHNRSAENIVRSFQKKKEHFIIYDCEPEQNIALARNRAVLNARGNFIAFLDDDEFADRYWLLNLYKALYNFKADGVLGPVIPYYLTGTPNWVIKGKFYERENHKTGKELTWQETRTGNVLLSKKIFSDKDNRFKAEFGRGGEDKDFFRRMIRKGSRFIWCSEAVVYEIVPKERCTRSFMLKRALVRGTQPHFNLNDYLKSVLAIPIYFLILPFYYFSGQHNFMKILIKIFDHIGRLAALVGINLVKDRYVQR